MSRPAARRSKAGRNGPPPHADARRIAALESLARSLDTRFRLPVVGWRFGWDGLIGLLPGVGDMAGSVFSAYIIAQGWRLGVRRRTLLRMMGNAGLDLAFGSVPLLGDAFDFAFKANTWNIDLILRDLERNGR